MVYGSSGIKQRIINIISYENYLVYNSLRTKDLVYNSSGIKDLFYGSSGIKDYQIYTE